VENPLNMTQGDIHYSEQGVQNKVEKIKNSENISEHNKQILLDLTDYMYGQDLSNTRVIRYLYSWTVLIEHIDWNLDEVEKKDLIELVKTINQNKVQEKDLSDHTLREYKKAIRKLYTDYMPSRESDFDGESLCDFFTLTIDTKKADPDNLLEPEHVKKLIRAAERTRDKAFMMVLWSSAGRIGEVLGLQWRDIRFGEDIAKLVFRDTKTGGDRKVPLHAGYLYLKELQEKDPRSGEPEAFVFRGLQTDEQISHQGSCKIIQRARDKAEIAANYKTNPHAWRKARATFLASKGMNQSQLCQFGGWVQGSGEVATYIRMAEEDVEEGLRAIAGLEKKEDEEQEDLNPVKCPKCGNLNKWEAEICENCDEGLKTSKMFEEVQIKETKEDLKSKMIEENIGVDDEELYDAAEELVKEKLDY
jgi:integrase